MAVLQRLLKLVQNKQAIENSNTTIKNETTNQVKEGKKEIVHSNNQKTQKRTRKNERINLDCNDLNKNLAALIRRHHFKAWFSNTLYTYQVCIKKDDIVRGNKKSVSVDQSSASTHNVTNEVLPISDTSTTSSTRRSKKKMGDEDQKFNKPKPISKMKELLRWSAGSKSQKQTGIKVSHFRKEESVNGFISESPKISFTLIPESCSTVGFNHQFHRLHRQGNWITTDGEFVVLEL